MAFIVFVCFFFADHTKHLPPTSYAPNLYQDLPPIGDRKADDSSSHYHSSFDLFSAKLGLMLPDSAPDPGMELPDTAPEPDVQPSKCIHTHLYIHFVQHNSKITEINFVHLQLNRLILAWK